MTTASNAAAEREMVVLHRYMGMLNGKEIGWSVWVECDHVNGDVYEPGSYEHATFRRVEGEGEKPAPDKPCAQFMETGLFCRVPFAEHGKEDHVFIWHDGPVSPKRPAPPPASGTEKCKHSSDPAPPSCVGGGEQVGAAWVSAPSEDVVDGEQ